MVGGMGVERSSEEFRTNTRRLAQFAEAIGDTNPKHLAGAIASPVFNHVPVMQSMVEVLDQVAKGFILHGEQDFFFHQPMLPGQRLFSEAKLIGTRNSSAGALYFVRCLTRTHAGEDICTQYATCLVQGEKAADTGEGPPEPPRVARIGEPTVARYAIGADQTFRYADAARDYSPYTLDAEYALERGLPHPIVHGMCTLALIARGIVETLASGETERLKRLGCRFSYPLYLRDGQELVVKTWREDRTAAFEAEDKDGNTVVKNGFAEAKP